MMLTHTSLQRPCPAESVAELNEYGQDNAA